MVKVEKMRVVVTKKYKNYDLIFDGDGMGEVQKQFELELNQAEEKFGKMTQMLNYRESTDEGPSSDKGATLKYYIIEATVVFQK